MTTIIASTGRPQKLARLLQSIPAHIPRFVHCKSWSDVPSGVRIDSVSFGNEGVVQSFNLLASSAADDILGACDDLVFSEGFFDALESFASKNPHLEVIGANVTNLKHPPAAVAMVRRSFIERRGFYLHPDFEHFYVDNELERAAKSIGVFGTCEDARLIHHHPVVSKEYDFTHSNGRREKHAKDTATWRRILSEPVRWLDTEFPAAAKV
jgi:hypothetical protein